jgi:hypothetical protein
MKKDDISSKLREYTQLNLSPTQKERDFIGNVYDHICKALNGNCIQIGSYPRFTAIHPVHDLDILYVAGNESSFNDNPQTILSQLLGGVKLYFRNNTSYKLSFGMQTHSVTVSFLDENNHEYFATDIVPAYVDGQNKFGLDMYLVPEIVKIGRSHRSEFYKTASESHSVIKWIKSDPRGYIKVVSDINENNPDYRRSVKFVKKWKYSASENNFDFKLKSFHIEQIFTAIFQGSQNTDIFDAIFTFFCDLPDYISRPQIKDRADENTYIDEYLNELTADQKKLIIQARDAFLIALEEFSESSSVRDLISAKYYQRHSDTEQYLFDFKIPVLTDSAYRLSIDGYLRWHKGFREYKYPIRTDRPLIAPNNYIRFQTTENNTNANLYKWKVKNSNDCTQPRGEITDHRTRNDPETTKYPGEHNVECFAIKNNICVAKDKVPVLIS